MLARVIVIAFDSMQNPSRNERSPRRDTRGRAVTRVDLEPSRPRSHMADVADAPVPPGVGVPPSEDADAAAAADPSATSSIDSPDARADSESPPPPPPPPPPHPPVLETMHATDLLKDLGRDAAADALARNGAVVVRAAVPLRECDDALHQIRRRLARAVAKTMPVHPAHARHAASARYFGDVASPSGRRDLKLSLSRPVLRYVLYTGPHTTPFAW